MSDIFERNRQMFQERMEKTLDDARNHPNRGSVGWFQHFSEALTTLHAFHNQPKEDSKIWIVAFVKLASESFAV